MKHLALISDTKFHFAYVVGGEQNKSTGCSHGRFDFDPETGESTAEARVNYQQFGVSPLFKHRLGN